LRPLLGNHRAAWLAQERRRKQRILFLVEMTALWLSTTWFLFMGLLLLGGAR
jgi:hypothetical protein